MSHPLGPFPWFSMEGEYEPHDVHVIPRDAGYTGHVAYPNCYCWPMLVPEDLLLTQGHIWLHRRYHDDRFYEVPQ